MNTETYAGRLIARLFLCSKSAYTKNRISSGLFFRKYGYKNSAFFAFRHSFAECFHRYSAHAVVDKNKDNKTIFLSPNITEPDTGKDFK